MENKKNNLDLDFLASTYPDYLKFIFNQFKEDDDDNMSDIEIWKDVFETNDAEIDEVDSVLNVALDNKGVFVFSKDAALPHEIVKGVSYYEDVFNACVSINDFVSDSVGDGGEHTFVAYYTDKDGSRFYIKSSPDYCYDKKPIHFHFVILGASKEYEQFIEQWKFDFSDTRTEEEIAQQIYKNYTIPVDYYNYD